MTNDDNKITNLAVSMHHQKGVYAVLLGAGASRGAQMPTAWDIVRDLIRQKMTAQGITLPETEDGLDAWFEQTYNVQADYLTSFSFGKGRPARLLISK